MIQHYDNLIELYQKAFNACQATFPKLNCNQKEVPANPLILNPDDRFWNADVKVMYIGQETNGYEGEFPDLRGVEHLQAIYHQFVNEGNAYRYGGQFWNGVRHFDKIFSKYYARVGKCWNNWYKIGRAHDRGAPPPGVIEWQKPFTDLIVHEILSFSPDIIISLSGPYYDQQMIHAIGYVSKQTVSSDYKEKELCLMKSPNFQTPIYRTYHPNYLCRAKNVKLRVPAVAKTIISHFLTNGAHQNLQVESPNCTQLTIGA